MASAQWCNGDRGKPASWIDQPALAAAFDALEFISVGRRAAADGVCTRPQAKRTLMSQT
jgi:hypothetical protein